MKIEIKPSELAPIKEKLEGWRRKITEMALGTSNKEGFREATLNFITPNMQNSLKEYYSQYVAESIINDLIRTLDDEEREIK